MRRLLQRKLCRRKTLLFTLFLLSLTIGITPLSAKEVTDVLTNAGLINKTTTTYTAFSGKSFSSNAVYAGNIAGDGGTIQMTNKTATASYIATTGSGGVLKKIKLYWNTKTTTSSSSPRKVAVYAKNTAYTTNYSDNKVGTNVSTLQYSKDNPTSEYTFNADTEYTYIALFAVGGALYLDKIEITWESGTTSEPQNFDSAHDQFTGLTWNGSAYDLTMTYGDTFTLSPKSSTSPAITYAIADGAATDVVSIDGNKLTALKAGTTTITASWSADGNWKADTRTINVTVNHAPVCGDITFSPAAGEVARGTEVTLSCENATEITYTVTPTGGTASEPTTVTANTAKVTINEACTISATAKNKEGVATTTFTAKYTITAAPLCGDITFSPADGSVVDAGSTVTISCENAAKITYTVTTDGVAEDPVVVTGSSATVTINAACTITAKAENADGVATEEFSASYTLPVLKGYTLFTDYGADDSVPDGDYIFVGKVTKGDKTYYMEGQNGTNGYRTATEVTPNDGVISVKESFEIHIQKESDSNYSLITKDGKYLYDNSNDKSINLYEGTETQGKGIWTPSFNEGNLVFKTGSNYLCFNASSPRFKTYSSIQAYFSLYAPKSDALGDIKFSPASGSTVDEGTEITISAQNATSLAYSIKTGDVWSESVMITGNSVNVPVTEDCTISVIAKNDETHEQKSAEATYTVVHPVTYELVEEYNGNDIPNGDYIFASSKDDGSSFAIMGNKIDKYREAIPVTPTGNKFDAYARYAIKVQKEGNGNYSLITSEGKYLYSNTSQDLKEGDVTKAGKWKPEVTGSTVLFTYIDADADANVDAVIKYNISTTPTRFKAYKASSTNGMRPISLYTVQTTKCGTVIFNPAPGSEVPINSTVKISCKNATQISYSITKDGVYQATVDVPGNTAEVTITENCTIQAQGTNDEGDSEIAYANYTVQTPFTLYTDFYEETGTPYIPDGDYVLVGSVSSGESAGEYYMAEQKDDYRVANKIQPLEDGRLPIDNKYQINIKKEDSGNYSLTTADGKYIYAVSSTKTSGEGESQTTTTTYSVKEGEAADGQGKWKANIEKGKVYFSWAEDESYGHFKFNPQSPRFKTYDPDSNSMVSFSLYSTNIPLCRDLKFDHADRSSVVRGSSVTISCINAAKIFYSVDSPFNVTTVEGNKASVIISDDCMISAYAVNAAGVRSGDEISAFYTVIDPYVQFTGYGSEGSVPDGKYLFVGQNATTGALSYMAEEDIDSNGSIYRNAVEVTPFEDGRIGVSDKYAITVKKEEGANYSLITADGKYLYAYSSTDPSGEGESQTTTTTYSVIGGDADQGQGQWTANVADNKVEFAWSNPDMGTLRFNSGASRFKTYVGSTGTKFYLYAPTPKPAQVVCDATITNKEIKIAVNKTITFKSEGAGKMACEILEDDEEGNSVETFEIVDGDTYVFTTSPKATYQVVNIIPYDQYGAAHTPSSLCVGVTTFNLPKISYHFVDGEDKAAFYADNGTITEIRPYRIDGTLEEAGTYSDNVIPFRFSQPRFKVTAQNEIGDTVEESFSFIDVLSEREGVESPYSAYLVYKNATGTTYERNEAVFELDKAVDSFTYSMEGVLLKGNDLKNDYPFLLEDYTISLHVSWLRADSPIFLQAKDNTGSEAPARAKALDDIDAAVGIYDFVESGGAPLYFNSEGKNAINGSVVFVPFEYAQLKIDNIQDVVTAIGEILDEDDTEEVFYNLQGVRVENPDKGIYIRVKGNKTEKILK